MLILCGLAHDVAEVAPAAGPAAAVEFLQQRQSVLAGGAEHLLGAGGGQRTLRGGGGAEALDGLVEGEDRDGEVGAEADEGARGLQLADQCRRGASSTGPAPASMVPTNRS
jgi:hypothetical protein